MNTNILTTSLATILTLPLAAQQGNMDSPFQVHRNPAPAVARPAVGDPVIPPATFTVLSEDEVAERYDHFSFDIRGFYGIRAAAHSAYATDMVGAEAEFAWYVSPRQAFTLSASLGKGGSGETNYIDTPDGPFAVSDDFSRTDFTLMLGYRFTQKLTKRTSLSLGLKGGLDVQNLGFDDVQAEALDEGRWEWDDEGGTYEKVYDDHHYSVTRCGFAYAASLTLETQLTERLQLLMGYQYRGATTEPKAPSFVPGGPTVSARSLRWHELHLGLRFVY